MAKAYLVGSGIASPAAAASLIRDAGFDGRDITIREERDREGGRLDAAGSPETGYTRNGRSTASASPTEPWHPARPARAG